MFVNSIWVKQHNTQANTNNLGIKRVQHIINYTEVIKFKTVVALTYALQAHAIYILSFEIKFFNLYQLGINLERIHNTQIIFNKF